MNTRDFDHDRDISSNMVCGDGAKFLNFFESYLADTLECLDEPVRDLARQVVLGGGKRLRPLLVYHCGAESPDATDDLLKAAAILEIVHVATLVHDDILDKAKVRRSKATLHTRIGEHSAILLGDALFSFALELATQFTSTRICRLVSKATRRTCSGEIMQTFARGNYDVSLTEYFSFIQNKTGELFKASCQAGAFLAGNSETLIELAGEFGLSLGLNYQIFDDLMDSFGNTTEVGKCLGTDFDTGKITLPLLLLLQKLPSKESAEIKAELSSDARSVDTRKQIMELFDTYDIRDECIAYLAGKLNGTRLIASNIGSKVVSDRLHSFMSSFDGRLSALSTETTPNFLALNQ